MPTRWVVGLASLARIRCRWRPALGKTRTNPCTSDKSSPGSRIILFDLGACAFQERTRDLSLRSSSADGPRGSAASAWRASVHLLGEVALTSELLDQAELRFEPIHGVFLVLQDLFEQGARSVVALRRGERDAAIQPRNGFLFEL